MLIKNREQAMSRKERRVSRSSRSILYVVLSGCFALAACGGGGGNGTNPPPPPPPPPPGPLVATNICTSTPAGQTLIGALPGSGNGATYVAGSVSPVKGSVTIDVAGNYLYIPRTNLPSGDGKPRGVDKFSYRLTDHGQTSEALVSVLIDGSVRIMPIGDSITAGVSGAGSPNELPVNQQVSYRRKLFNDLEAMSSNYGINFVGSLNAEGSAANPPLADRDHEGHPGWCDDNNPSCNVSGGQTVDGNITNILNTNPPDLILLHIGTNEFSTDAGGVNSILNKINAWASTNYPVTVFLARIIPSSDGHLDVNAFNNNVQAIADDRLNAKIFMVDQQSELHNPGDPNPNKADPTLIATTAVDTLHPNQAGYERMAGRWKADIGAAGVLPTCQ